MTDLQQAFAACQREPAPPVDPRTRAAAAFNNFAEALDLIELRRAERVAAERLAAIKGI